MPAITERARPSDPVRALISGAVAEVDGDFTLLDVVSMRDVLAVLLAAAGRQG